MTENVNRLGNWLITGEVRWRRNRQVAAIYRGLRTILPLIVLGTFAEFINQAWLEPNGYYYQTLHVARWMLQRVRVQEAVLLLQNGTLGLAAIGLAFVISHDLVATATPVTNDQMAAGFTAVLGFELININPLTLAVGKPVQWLAMDLGLHGLPVGVLIGLLVGNVYRWIVLRWRQPANQLLRPMTLSLSGMVLMGLTGMLWLLRQPFSIRAAFNTLIRWPLQLSNDVWRLLDFSALNGWFTWLGVLGPIPTTPNQTQAQAENLAAAIQHSGWHLPHPLTVQSVIQTYASMGGPGMTLGLVLAIFLVRHNAEQRQIGWLTLIPTLGNFNAPLLLGLPVVLSPILGIPLLLAPLATILVSSGFLAAHWIPAAAYPLAVGTPGPLIGYLGTSGALTPLLLAALDLALSTAIYYPFVKWASLAQARVEEEAQAHATI